MQCEIVDHEDAATRANFEELKCDTDREMYFATVHCNHLSVVITELKQADEGDTYCIQELEG